MISAGGIPARVAAVLKSAAKVSGAAWLRLHRQIDRDLELVSSSPVTDEEIREDFGRIALIEETQLRIRDDLGALPAGAEAAVYIVTIQAEDGRELARDRLRLRVEGAIERAGDTGPAPGSRDWEASEARTPSSAVMQAAIVRQQYRHNEALAKSVVGAFAGTMEKTTGLIASLADKLEASYAARARDAEQSIAVARAQRTMEAEARAEEMRGEALKLAASTFAEWFPVAVHKIARKYGASGDAAIDPILEKLVLSFKPEQLDGLAQVLTPMQQQILGDLWVTVKDRVDARAKAKAEADAKAKLEGGPVAGVMGAIVEHAKGNGAAKA